jgi:CRISPR/Cas system-associated protein Cas5 (RAMP superfamily)
MSLIGNFTALGLTEKVKLLYRKGEFVMSIRYYSYKVNLYLLNDLYFEVFYNHKLDCIEKIELLDEKSSRMKFYADQIKLTNLSGF